jgi:hypothetical protein
MNRVCCLSGKNKPCVYFFNYCFSEEFFISQAERNTIKRSLRRTLVLLNTAKSKKSKEGMQEFLILLFTLLTKVLNVQVSDTASDAICTIAGIDILHYKIIQHRCQKCACYWRNNRNPAITPVAVPFVFYRQ